jgi:RNA polymerase sigma-70 factor, ECF subfamily
MPVPQQAVLSETLLMADPAQTEVEGVIREHSHLVFKISFSVLRNHHDAEDATQETFLRFLRGRKKLGGIRDVRAYLARTAWRVAHGRRKQVWEISLEEAAEVVLHMRSAGMPAEEIMAKREAMALLERLIDSLPGDLRETLALSTVEELSSAEIAGLLGIPEGSVRTRLMRARQILREKLTAVFGRRP